MRFFFFFLILSVSLSSHEFMQEAVLTLMQAQVDQMEKINHKLSLSSERLESQFVLGVLEKNSLVNALTQELLEHFLIKMRKDGPYFSEKLEKMQNLLFLFSQTRSSLDPTWIEKVKQELDSFSLLIISSKTGQRKPPFRDKVQKKQNRCPQKTMNFSRCYSDR